MMNWWILLSSTLTLVPVFAPLLLLFLLKGLGDNLGKFVEVYIV